jgi:uncharacterized protein DUF1348
VSRPPLPPFDAASAAQKVRMAEDAWNTRNPVQVALAYIVDTRWRNRAEFLLGRDAIVAFLTRKWNRELDYRLIKELWAFRLNRTRPRAIKYAARCKPVASSLRADRYARRADRRPAVPLRKRNRPARNVSARQGNMWWAREDSNLQPSGYEPLALTIELRARGGGP